MNELSEFHRFRGVRFTHPIPQCIPECFGKPIPELFGRPFPQLIGGLIP